MNFLERFWLGCGHCHGGEGCPLADTFDADGRQKHPYGQGPALVAAVVLVFILPIALALVGGLVANRWVQRSTPELRDWLQIGGAIVGFFAGVIIARFIFWVRRRCTPAKEGAE